MGGAPSSRAVEEEVYENERWVSLKGWAASNLRPDDPSHFQHQRQLYDSFPDVPAPVGWEWDSGWELDRGGGALEKDGWAYGPSFEAATFPPPPGAHKAAPTDTVRRRRWVRLRRRAGDAKPSGGSQAGARPSPHGQLIRDRQVLGLAHPGEALPLPIDWYRTGKQLQLRPVMDAAAAAVHDWSVGATAGSHTLVLDSLDEGITRLVGCTPLKADGTW